MKKTSFLIATLLIGICSTSCEKKIGCTDFKTGTFLIANDTTFVGAHTSIKTDDYHIQISPKGDTTFAKVEWINDCSYKLKYDKSKMHLSNFQINVNRLGGILVEFKQPEKDVMPYFSVIKGETKTEVFEGFIKKVK